MKPLDSKETFDSIAIAGAWGYIGSKILEAAVQRGIQVYAYDPGPSPRGLCGKSVRHVPDESTFYNLQVDCFHLALQPGVRAGGLARLLERARTEAIWILNEKPMVQPEAPEEAAALMAAVQGSRAVMLFDFPELFDPLTQRIVGYLHRFHRVEITSIEMERSKDREDPTIPRNYKFMFPIQFQESVHCLAYVIYLLGALRGGIGNALRDGLKLNAHSEPYTPPNPETYAYQVDGRCDYQLNLGPVRVDGVTNFKRGARWSKRRTLRGQADGQPLIIEADYLEGQKWLRIQGEDQGWEAGASSYEAILSSMASWRRTVTPERLLSGVYPNPQLAWLAFQLSGVLWKSCHERRQIELADTQALCQFDSGFAQTRSSLPRYAGAAAEDRNRQHGD